MALLMCLEIPELRDPPVITLPGGVSILMAIMSCAQANVATEAANVGEALVVDDQDVLRWRTNFGAGLASCATSATTRPSRSWPASTCAMPSRAGSPAPPS